MLLLLLLLLYVKYSFFSFFSFSFCIWQVNIEFSYFKYYFSPLCLGLWVCVCVRGQHDACLIKLCFCMPYSTDDEVSSWPQTKPQHHHKATAAACKAMCGKSIKNISNLKFFITWSNTNTRNDGITLRPPFKHHENGDATAKLLLMVMLLLMVLFYYYKH